MGCLYCLEEVFFVCVNKCLTVSNITPSYTNLAIGGMLLSFVSVVISFVFKNNLKTSLGFKLLGIASLTTGVITLGFIFNGHWFLKNIPYIIPSIGIGSYTVSYFFSTYFIKYSHKPVIMKNKIMQKYVYIMCRRLEIKKPELYTFDSGECHAFLVGGYKKIIFVSSGMIKKLNLKELKYVILHELYHLKRNSTVFKNFITSFGNLGFRILPVPIQEFEELEEKEIDGLMLKDYGIDMNKIRKKLSGK